MNLMTLEELNLEAEVPSEEEDVLIDLIEEGVMQTWKEAASKQLMSTVMKEKMTLEAEGTLEVRWVPEWEECIEA